MIKKINTGDSIFLKQKAVPCIPLIMGGLTQAFYGDNKYPWPQYVINTLMDLIETGEANHEKCVGLASNQIWDDMNTPPPAIFIVKSFIDKDVNKRYWKEFINPIVTTSGRTIKMTEQCLSYPGNTFRTRREANVSIEYQSIDNIEKIKEKHYTKINMLPIIIQHEYDHLLGKAI